MRSAVILINEYAFTSNNTPLLNLLGISFNELFCEFFPILFILIVLCWPTHTTAFNSNSAVVTSNDSSKFSIGGSYSSLSGDVQ